MEGKRLLRSLALKNLLSFGSKGIETELQPLNVLIGPNGSGKSNFIEAFRLLKAAPADLTQPIIQGGGIHAWLYQGDQNGPTAQIETVVAGDAFFDLKHSLSFTINDARIRIVEEKITHLSGAPDESGIYGNEIYINAERQALIRKYENSFATISQPGRIERQIPIDKLKTDQSILSQRSDPDIYPFFTYLAEVYRGIGLYADIQFGRNTPARRPQNADLDQHYLFEDASNLALVLNDLQNQPGVRRTIVERLQQFNPRVEEIITRVSYGTVQVYIQEKGLQQTVPATRLSDGMLRYLYLLVLLCHPSPPPLVCIEEPELGMHPDIIRGIAELLIEAAKRTQLIVTTHSDLLVSALSEVPESIVVCEHDGQGSTLRRLESDRLNLWLENYSLGDLWLKGEIGGTRW